MKRYIYTLCFILTAALSLTSCLNSDDVEVTLSDDMAITSFSLSSYIRNIHTTTKDGKDSVYKSTVTSGMPVFTIDHYKRQIYNTAPLPADCDLSHILAAITSKNSGLITINYPTSTGSDSLVYYNSTDSIDFSKPREIRVYAASGVGFRSYTVTLKASQQEAGKMVWKEVSSDTELPVALQQDIRVLPQHFNMFSISKDGWKTKSDEFIGEGEDWTQLPDDQAGEVGWVRYPYSGSPNTYYELMVGSNSHDDKACTVWRKVENKEVLGSPTWVNIPLLSTNPYYLPKMSKIALVRFDNKVLAIGNDGNVYESRDHGITWKVSTKITLPEDIDKADIKAASEDDLLWLHNPSTGKTWTGSLTEN